MLCSVCYSAHTGKGQRTRELTTTCKSHHRRAGDGLRSEEYSKNMNCRKVDIMRSAIKRVLTCVSAIAMAFSVMAVPAFASNENSNFQIQISSNYAWGANQVSVRKKDNSTSAYVNYNIPTSPSRIVVRIDGALSSKGGWHDCTSVIYGTSTHRRDAVVVFGQKGYIRQDVYERFGSSAWARILARTADGSSGTANGKWSPDSVWESGCIEFNN